MHPKLVEHRPESLCMKDGPHPAEKCRLYRSLFEVYPWRQIFRGGGE